MSFDDQYLFTVGEDSSLFIYKATDKEGRGLKRDKELVYAEEILITKSDLEEKVRAYVVLLNYIVNTWICHMHAWRYHWLHNRPCHDFT